MNNCYFLESRPLSVRPYSYPIRRKGKILLNQITESGKSTREWMNIFRENELATSSLKIGQEIKLTFHQETW